MVLGLPGWALPAVLIVTPHAAFSLLARVSRRVPTPGSFHIEVLSGRMKALNMLFSTWLYESPSSAIGVFYQ